VQEGCKKEIESYCKQVTPGESRVLSCLYAYQDQLSGRCEYALYDAAAQLERVVGALAYVANECGADLEKHCAAIQPGEGRLAQCLKKNEKNISERCRQAMKDISEMQPSGRRDNPAPGQFPGFARRRGRWGLALVPRPRLHLIRFHGVLAQCQAASRDHSDQPILPQRTMPRRLLPQRPGPMSDPTMPRVQAEDRYA
jgi:hypothetical protein